MIPTGVNLEIKKVDRKKKPGKRKNSLTVIRKKLFNQKRMVKREQKKNRKIWDKRKDVIKKVRTYEHFRVLRARQVTASKVREKANELYFEKVKELRLKKFTYIDGVTAFPIITKFAKEEGLTHNQLCVFILINHFNWFQIIDGIPFGYEYKQLWEPLEILVAKGWVDKIVGKRVTYVATVKGESKFKSIQISYTRQTRMLFESLDKKQGTKKIFMSGLPPKQVQKKNADKQDNTEQQ